MNIGGDMYAGSSNISLGGNQVKPNPNTIYSLPVASSTPPDISAQRIKDTAYMFKAPEAKPAGNPYANIQVAPKVVQPVKKLNSAKPVKAM